jgi:hypothetical protein
MYQRLPFGPLSRWNSGAHMLQQPFGRPARLNTVVSAALASPPSVVDRRMVTVEFHVVVAR